jgi:hypothetical protein
VRGATPNGAGHVPAGEPEPPQLVVWHELLDQRKELSLLKPDVCVKQVPRRIKHRSFDDARPLRPVARLLEPHRRARSCRSLAETRHLLVVRKVPRFRGVAVGTRCGRVSLRRAFAVVSARHGKEAREKPVDAVLETAALSTELLGPARRLAFGPESLTAAAGAIETAMIGGMTVTMGRRRSAGPTTLRCTPTGRASHARAP